MSLSRIASISAPVSESSYAQPTTPRPPKPNWYSTDAARSASSWPPVSSPPSSLILHSRSSAPPTLCVSHSPLFDLRLPFISP
eukprot:scaffold13117_cov65-Phaeocystis_antarctica.AAC.4